MDPQQYGTYQQAPQTYRKTQDWYGNVNQSSLNIQRTQEAAGTPSSFGASNQSRTATTQHNTNSGHQQTQYSYNTGTSIHGLPSASTNQSYNTQNQSYGNTQPQSTCGNTQGQGGHGGTQAYTGQLQQRPNSVNSVASSHTQQTHQRRTSQATQADNQPHNNYYQHQQIAQAYASGVDRSVSPAQIQASRQLQNLQAGNRPVQQQNQAHPKISLFNLLGTPPGAQIKKNTRRKNSKTHDQKRKLEPR
jgi:hypothetical protein